MKRRQGMPFGAETAGSGMTRFRLWAPSAKTVGLCLEGPGPTNLLSMVGRSNGWWSRTAYAPRGTLYRYLIDGEMRVPDPASRFQPNDVHGASEVVDPTAYQWNDGGWRGRPWHEVVLYELHVGTFTPTGNYQGVIDRLDHLVDLGITAIELMPVADWPGTRNWGYDGVYLFAPDSRYGRPEDLKRLIDSAHACGLMVYLDVVYNHFGPEGNYLYRYAPQFFTDRHHTPWGAAINFDGPGSRTVRDFFLSNAMFWLREYHIDGLRIDAVHAIYDGSQPDFVTELAANIRSTIGSRRKVHVVLENHGNTARFLRRNADGEPIHCDGQWSDDLHHALHVILTGEGDGYYMDFVDQTHRLLGRSLAECFAFQGEKSLFGGGVPRGEPSRDLPATSVVSILQDHDQIGNRAFGERITELAPAEAVRAALALILLAPAPPLLFMGEEWGAKQPFLFFCDLSPDLATAVREGRRNEFARLPAFHDEAARAKIPDPLALTTYTRCILDWSDLGAPTHREWFEFYRRLLAIRAAEITPRVARLRGGGADYRTFGEGGLEVSWRLADNTQLRLHANLSHRANASPSPHSGRLIFATDCDPASAGMPPWCVRWHLNGG
jgi:malto-oligosyltrehalose trehalohydrolase